MKFKHIGKKNAANKQGSAEEKSSLSRRNFLRNGSSAGVGIGLIVTSKTALGQKATKEGVVRCGIIGYGDEGEALKDSSKVLRDSKGELNVRFVAVSDIWGRNLRKGVGQIAASGQGGGQDGKTCTPYADAEEMIKKENDLDCIIVATPDFVHDKYSIMGLEAGLDVYCEKLMSNDIEKARAMVKTQRATNKLLQIGHQRRSNPRYLHVKNEILNQKNNLLGWITHMSAQWNRSRGGSVPREIPQGKDALDDQVLKDNGYNGGAMGMFEFRNWRMYKKFGGGIISDLGAHQIDIFNWLLDTTPNSIFAQGGTDYYTGEFLNDLLTSEVEEALEKTKSSKRKAKLQAELEIVSQVKDGYEHADNVMAFFEYDTPRAKWGTKGGTGDILKTRAYYQVLTTSSSQKFFEKFMGEDGTMSISELTEYNQIYREAHARSWEEYGLGAKPLIEKDISQEEIYHKFWEKKAPWRAAKTEPGKWNADLPEEIKNSGVADARVSKGLDPWELPSHVQFKERPHAPHLRNFFDAVRNNGSQDDLNCPAIEGFKTTVTCMKIHEAIEKGEKIEFKPEDFVV
ncbi:MAG: Gfo/Idh/MocA family oxidoreductase [Verrucomicrobiaceae bacterium]|nr:Gfo/Idh/MocA family oxidoreductase [Verrucomicrobiaceae bacterium]